METGFEHIQKQNFSHSMNESVLDEYAKVDIYCRKIEWPWKFSYFESSVLIETSDASQFSSKSYLVALDSVRIYLEHFPTPGQMLRLKLEFWPLSKFLESHALSVFDNNRLFQVKKKIVEKRY